MADATKTPNAQGGHTIQQTPSGPDPYSPQAIAYYQALEAQQKAQQVGQAASAAGFNGIPLDASGLISQLPPEIQAIFNEARDAASKGTPLTTDAFQGKLIETQWWKSTPDTQRQYVWSQIIDPATATQQGNQAAFKVLQAASNMGRPMTLAQAAQLGQQMIVEGWNDAMLQQKLATLPIGAGQTFGPGALRTAMAQIHGTAADYGMNISDLGAAGWAQKIVAGSTDVKGFEDYARQQAALAHPYWSKQLNEGVTLRQLADPYIQTAAKTLELSPDQIDLSDAKWGAALQQKDKGGAVVGPMSQLDWQRKIMSDPAYGYDHTQGAMDTAYQMRDSLAKTFGFTGAA